MQTKHTFLFTMLLGLAWVGYLFAYVDGPDPAVNGILGAGTACSQAGCHAGNPENSLGLAVTISGLPAEWTPGQTYPLQVVVPRRTGTIKYGFQLSAVFDSNRQQAGTLASGANTVQVISGGGVQYAEHNRTATSVAPGGQFPNTYNVNWTAPANASGGMIRFNVAGNAANGDNNNTGDFIYTAVQRISPASAVPPDFTIAAAAPGISLPAGSSGTLSVNAAAANGFNGAVDLAIDGLPCGSAAAFDPSSIQAGAASTLTVSTAPGAKQGVFPLTITATSGALVHTTTVSLTISPGGGPTQNFALANLAGVSLSTAGGCDQVSGFVRIQHEAGSTTPSGVEIFGLTKNNILISETGVTASPLLTQGRIYAEESGPLHTGIAIANPNNQAANIQFVYTDSNGTSTAPKNLPAIAPNSQIARFLFQDEFFPGQPLEGAFSFTSDVPVSVIALRGLTNEDGDFLMSTLPVIDTTLAASTGTQVVPHFATGDGWTTQVFLVNQGTTALSGNLQFIDANGAPVNVVVAGQTANTASYSVPGRGAQKFVVSGPTAGGSVRIVPTGGGAAPSSVVLFSQKRPSGVTATEAAASVSLGTAFRMYVETSAAAAGTIDSGIAVANTTSAPVNVSLELFNLDGSSAGLPPVVLSLPASGKTATFVGQQFPGAPRPFKGILRITSPATISVAGLRSRYNQRPQPDFLITTTPISLETAAAGAGEMLFPHLVDGAGYTTQFILFSGSAGQTSSGTLQFFTTSGQALSLSLNN